MSKLGEKDAPVAVIAVGGNALAPEGGGTNLHDQARAAADAAGHIADVAEQGWRVVLTHGNGPQVGYILRRSELAIQEVPPVPMDYATADTQGAIGDMFQRSLYNALQRRGVAPRVVTVVTQVVVDEHDPAFQSPAKPIGSIMDEATARQRAQSLGWNIMEEAGRGWRRCVASPRPQRVVETDTIRALLAQNHIVIACGGGGIPVTMAADGTLCNREAVIDKDLASALLARQLGAQRLVIVTAVPKVAIHFGKPEQRWLDHLTVAEAERFMEEGHFGRGSMGPKIEAVLEYVRSEPGGEGIVTDISSMGAALAGAGGTRISG
ncbi:carbamate kinase [Cupriavidus agavae]|uniref:Carbamate kinase n=1 Tax=Cupriavidus agavae TaxID=1001822 RepID=A0A4Q7S188_9BURK|nr:carbamate kinase [Cupriavidus agavae]RZT38712.1 carbamate kinase [Cupriavidus agavae]